MIRSALPLAVALVALPALAAAPRACFTPEGDCAAFVVAEIGKARKTVLVQASSVTSFSVADALVKARGRGVEVRAILDKASVAGKYSGADVLTAGGVPVQVDGAHATAGSQVVMIDGATVLTGSFDFSKTAHDRNAENLVAIDGKRLAAAYAANWRKHAAHAEPYQPRSP